jgi:hypothetical protein
MYINKSIREQLLKNTAVVVMECKETEKICNQDFEKKYFWSNKKSKLVGFFQSAKATNNINKIYIQKPGKIDNRNSSGI